MNSKQERKDRRNTIRVLKKLSGVVGEQFRPMIKDECRADFEEIVNGLDHLMTHELKPRRQERWPVWHKD